MYLSSYEFDRPTGTADPATVLERLLEGFTGLEILKIDFGERHWNCDEISFLSVECQRLRQLSFRIDTVEMASPVFSALVDSPPLFELSCGGSGGWSRSLQAIARLPHLVTLHIRNWPLLPILGEVATLHPQILATYREYHLRQLTEACMQDQFAPATLKVMAWGRGARSGVICFTREVAMNVRGKSEYVARRRALDELKFHESEVQILTQTPPSEG